MDEEDLAGRPLKRLVDEADTGLSGSGWWRMKMMTQHACLLISILYGKSPWKAWKLLF